MKKTTYERLQNGTRIVAGIIEKTDNTGRQYYNVFVRWKQGQNKIERTDFTTIYSREMAIKNSHNMLEQVGIELTKMIKNNPMGKTYMIDGQPMKIIYATPVDRPKDGLSLWNITTDTGLELQEWYPEYEIK